MFEFFRRKGKSLQSTLACDVESHLEIYLDYYIKRKEPGYAVLVTGEWGAGKTYQVRRALPDDRAHYVSLFGLTKIEDIEAEIFAKMFPSKASLKKFAKRVDSVNIEIPVLGSLGSGGLASILATSFIKNQIDNTRPLIFDDLERCSVEHRAVLGLINRYVEHYKCRVIVIAHDDKIVQEIKESKEKVFGQSILVEPSIDSAFKEFVSYFSDNENKRKISEFTKEILSTFRESKAASLRVLRHVVEDVMRLADALEDRHLEDRAAMVELVRLFSALAIETRCNHLNRDDLKDREGATFRYELNTAGKNEKLEEPRFVAAAYRYKLVDLASTLLNDTVLTEMLIEGHFNPSRIRESLNSSHYFIDKEEASPWRIVINFDKLDDAEIDAALKKMDKQFEEREVTDSGEFLHMVALKMLMASECLIEMSVREVVDAAKIYLDELLEDDRLPPRTVGWNWSDSFKGAYAGVGYWVAEDYRKDFEEVFNYLTKLRSSALNNKIPELIPTLLEVIRGDGKKFYEKLCGTRDGRSEYEDVPILAQIPTFDFVEAWLSSPKAGWYWISSALKERNKATSLYENLAVEADWFPKLAEEMLKRSEKKSGLARIRIIRAVEFMGYNVDKMNNRIIQK
ncbi:hypothetical protein [Pannonibacter indicus]|uniref:hypothetical protein n=1 Tax=Pannonibacter indicus TaxID=466044 RepID=UPI0035B2824E